MHMGEFASAIQHFEKTLTLYDPERHRDDAFFYTQNPGVGMRCFAAWALWFLGQPDQALNRVQEALTLARELSEPHGIAYALSFAAILHQLRREPRMAQEYAEEGLAISTEYGLVMYTAQSTMTRAWALIERGRRGEGIEQMRQGFAAYQATGTELLTPYFGSLLAEALGKERKAEEGLRGLKEWVEVAHLNGNESHLAEAYRIMGELLFVQSKSRAVSQAPSAGKAAFEAEPPSIAQVEACFNQSIKIAREQKAKSWELRTVMSVARLYQNQGKQKQAQVLLAEIYDRFTEGFDTVDLREAKALLDKLS
jgi:predicted ATPase